MASGDTLKEEWPGSAEGLTEAGEELRVTGRAVAGGAGKTVHILRRAERGAEPVLASLRPCCLLDPSLLREVEG